MSLQHTMGSTLESPQITLGQRAYIFYLGAVYVLGEPFIFYELPCCANPALGLPEPGKNGR